MRRTVCSTCVEMDSGHSASTDCPVISSPAVVRPRTTSPPTQERMTPSRRTMSARSGSDQTMSFSSIMRLSACLAQHAKRIDGIVMSARRRQLEDDPVRDQSIDIRLHSTDDGIQSGNGLRAEPATPRIAHTLGAIQNQVGNFERMFPAHGIKLSRNEG